MRTKAVVTPSENSDATTENMAVRYADMPIDSHVRTRRHIQKNVPLWLSGISSRMLRTFSSVEHFLSLRSPIVSIVLAFLNAYWVLCIQFATQDIFHFPILYSVSVNSRPYF